MSDDSDALILAGVGALALGGFGFFAVKAVSDKKEFLKLAAVSALPVSKQMGIPLSIIVTQAAHESNYGKSLLAREGNNLFGIKADSRWTGPVVSIPTKEFIGGKEITVQAKWRKYPTWEASIRDWANFLKASRYQFAMRAALNEDHRQFFEELQKAGYATDPEYASKLEKVYDQIGALV